MLGKYINRDFFKDRLLTVLSGSITLLSLLGAVWVLISVRAFDVRIPVRYSEYGINTLKNGPWFTLYDLSAFVVISGLIALFIALRTFKLNRTLALVVLVLQHVLLVFFFLVANAILNTLPGA